MRLSKRLLLLGIILLVLETSLVVAWNGLFGQRSGTHFGSWQIAEWLINYQGGFVRRGLAGQLLYWFGAGQNLLDVLYHMTFYLLLVYGLILVLVYALANCQRPAVFLLALLVPGGFLQMGISLQFFTRKEIVFLVCFGLLCITYLLAMRSVEPWRQRLLQWLYGCALLSSCCLMFMHEAFLFMGFPFTLVLLWVIKKENPANRFWPWAWWIYAGLIPLLFIVMGMHHGDTQIAAAIWDSLSLADRELLSPQAPYSEFGPIASIGWGLQQHLLTIYGIYATSGWLYWPIFIMGNGIVLFFFALQLAAQPNGFAMRLLYVLALAATLSASMFLIAADWGRWLAFITNSTVLLGFTLTRSSYATQCILVKPTWTRIYQAYWLWAIIWVYALSLRLPECCISPRYLSLSLGDLLWAFF